MARILLIDDDTQVRTMLKVIAISGGGRLPAAMFHKMAQNMGAVAVLKKPFERNELLETVRQALGPREDR